MSNPECQPCRGLETSLGGDLRKQVVVVNERLTGNREIGKLYSEVESVGWGVARGSALAQQVQGVGLITSTRENTMISKKEPVESPWSRTRNYFTRPT